MSWLNSVRNVIPFVVKKETPDNLWHKCKGCGQMVFTKELEDNLNVCPKCDHHDRIGPKVRFRHLLDEGSCSELPAPKVPEDPLKFRDSKRYADRLKAARVNAAETDALVNARGTILGHKVVVGVQDFAFMGGSMGLAVGEAFRFSFLISVPAVLGATLLEAIKLYRDGDMALPGGWFWAAAAAFVLGWIALKLMHRLVLSGRWAYFGLYCLLLGSAAILAALEIF